jgi:riboflavin kinase / FMN adenylyltransferase
MKIYTENDQIEIINPVVTVGTFDGVHLGHQYIFNQLIINAKKIKGNPVVVTFWPHPRMVVHPGGTEMMLLNTFDEKINLIEKLGVAHIIVISFSKEFSELTSAYFIEEYLYKRIGIKGLIMGFDHRFGKDRMGNSDELHQCAQKYGFFIKNVEAFTLQDEKISSTRIRNALFDGNIELANKLLSRNYMVTGNVVKGDKIGRNIGFPTANIMPGHNFKLIPADGVYAVKVIIDKIEHPGMLNIGHRPTLNKGNDNKTIEVHLIDYQGNLYDQEVTLSFYKKIRNELKFKSLDELRQQLIKDKITISNYFAMNALY